jgi:hypothetical protein
MSVCPTCGARCEGSHCFRHKPRTPLAKKSSFLSKKLDKSEEVVRQISEMQQFFLQIWRKRLHYSQVSMDYLGKEPLSVFFHHILPKEKYPQAMYDEENIILLTLEEHDNVERDMYKYPEVNRKRELLKTKYGIQ